MESIIKQGKKLCPFLRRTSPATMRMMATKSGSSGNGNGLSGLQQAALKCPVMSKHMGKAGAGGSGSGGSSHQSSPHGNGMSLNVSAVVGRSYVTASPVTQFNRTCRNAAELASLEDVHRTVGVTDLSRGMLKYLPIQILIDRSLSACRGCSQG